MQNVTVENPSLCPESVVIWCLVIAQKRYEDGRRSVASQSDPADVFLSLVCDKSSSPVGSGVVLRSCRPAKWIANNGSVKSSLYASTLLRVTKYSVSRQKRYRSDYCDSFEQANVHSVPKKLLEMYLFVRFKIP